MAACPGHRRGCAEEPVPSPPERTNSVVRTILSLEGGRISFCSHDDLLRSLLSPQKHLFDLEFESPAFSTPLALYVVYPDDFGGSWRMQAVPLSLDSFGDRKSLPEAWRGLRDDELSTKCGLEGCIFVHASGFTGGEYGYSGLISTYLSTSHTGNKTKSGALEMTKLALEM